MTVLFASVGLFVFAFFLQAAIWRVYLPQRQTPALLILLFAVLLVALVIVSCTGIFTVPDIFRIALFYIAFALGYTVFYSSLEMQSPTLSIVSVVSKTGSTGYEEAGLYERFGTGSEVDSRLIAMERGGWISRDGDTLRLTKAGRNFAKIFYHGARVFGIKTGG